MDSLYIVMPAYNEEENIEAAVRSWYHKLDGKSEESKLVVADSASTDGTHEILCEMQREFPKLVIISDTGKQHGPKLMALYDYAIEKGADYVFQTDSDGHTDPAEFDTLWDHRGDYVAIFGNRKERGDGKSRAFVERVVCFLLFLVFGVKVPDANAPFRLYETQTLKKYLHRLPDDYSVPNIMLTAYYAYYKEKIGFKRISFKARSGGVNSINFAKIIKIGCRSVVEFIGFRMKM